MLEANTQQVKEAYQSVRSKLTPEEQQQFDKVIEVLSATSESSSTRIRALDAALTLGMAAVTLHPLALEQLILGALTILAKCLIANFSFKADPRMNQ